MYNHDIRGRWLRILMMIVTALTAMTLVAPAANAADSVSTIPSAVIGDIGILPHDPGHKDWDGADRGNDLCYFTANDTAYALVVGRFVKYVRPDGSSVDASNLVIINMETGNARSTGLQVNGEILTCKTSSSGVAAYIGGNFSLKDDGETRRHAAKFNLSDGSLYPWNPQVNGPVQDIDLAGKSRNKVLLAGNFTTVGGANRGYFASVTATSGALTSWMKASISTPQDGDLGGYNIVTNSNGTRIIGTGSFTIVNGHAHSRVFVMKATKAKAVLVPWATNYTNNPCSPNKTHEELGVVFAGLYKFGFADTGSGARAGSICDSVSVWTLRKELKNTKAKPLWRQFTTHDSMSGIAFYHGYTYAAGHNKGCGSTAKDVADADRYDGLCQFNAKTGALSENWRPKTTRQSSMHVRLVPTPAGFGVSGLGYVGDVNHIGGQVRNDLAFFPL